MATGIQNYPNIEPADSDYPDGSIKDNPGDNTGTPYNKLVYDDIHQTFAKLLRLAGSVGSGGTTPNGLPENEYNGFQYLKALFELVGSHRKMIIMDDTNVANLIEGDYNEVVLVRDIAGPTNSVVIQVPTGANIGKVTVYNYSAYTFNILPFGSETIDSTTPPYVVPATAAVELTYDGVSDWEVTKRYLLTDII